MHPSPCGACEPEPEPGPDLTGAFLAGHLGNYADCPGGGFVPGGAGSDVSLADNTCTDGDCPFILCEDGMALVRLVNDGEAITQRR